MIWFLVLLAGTVTRGLRRDRGQATTDGVPALRSGPVPVPVQERLGAPASGSRGPASVGTGLAAVVLAIAVGAAGDPAVLGVRADVDGGVTPTGRTTTVAVSMAGMRFTPSVIRVPAGDRLVIVLTNRGTYRHDLVLENGARTPRLAPGGEARLAIGPVGEDLDGWCSVAGHRQMGMTLQVRVTGRDRSAAAGDPTSGTSTPPATAGDDATAHDAAGHDAAGHDAAGHGGADAGTGPAPAEPAREAVLPPAPTGTVHRHRLVVRETRREVAHGRTQVMWTYNGTVPGPVLRGRVGDVFEITLVNDGSIGHSIDFHAGALAPDRPMRTIQPGESLSYRFTARRAGAWMYHCSTMPMSVHIANGMFGAVVIDPPDLGPVDREYLLVQSELYLGASTVDADKVFAERPDLVVFNGYADQYRHSPLAARVGERVRFWVVDAGPNRPSAFHVVGGQFDTVYLWRAPACCAEGIRAARRCSPSPRRRAASWSSPSPSPATIPSSPTSWWTPNVVRRASWTSSPDRSGRCGPLIGAAGVVL